MALRLVEFLRTLGHDVLTSHEAAQANKQIDDAGVLAFAKENGRAVITNNRQDFRKLHRDGNDHRGIVEYTIDIDLKGLGLRIDQAVRDPQAQGRFYASVVQDGYSFRTK